MTIFNDVITFIKTLTFMDYIFLIAMIVLMLLVILLIYFFKENTSDEIIEINNSSDENAELLDLKKITEALESAPESSIDLNKYETEQEEKAIISYDELLKRKDDFALNYSEEENIADDLTVKKVDLNNLVNKDIIENTKINVQVISYEKEEALIF